MLNLATIWVAFFMQKKGVICIAIKLSWYICPYCGRKLLQYDLNEGKSKKIYIKCKQCKKIVEVLII